MSGFVEILQALQSSFSIFLICLAIVILMGVHVLRTRMRYQAEKSEQAKKYQHSRQNDMDLMKREYDKHLGDLKAKAEAGFAEERLKTDRVLSELERQKEISRIASSVSNEQAKKIQFFTDLAQEFRSPLSNIIETLDDVLAGDYGKLQSKTRRQMELTLRNARQLVRFMDQFHDISNLQAGKMEITRGRHDLVRFLREIVQTMAWYAEKKKIELKLETTVEELELYFDMKKMAEVFYHLLSNALKFAEEHGRILITVSDRPYQTEEPDEERVQLRVRNTGKTISQEDIPYLFDVFHRTSGSEVNRPRFGLSLVKELISLHGGTIQVRSEPGIGTEFTILLPRGKFDSLEAAEVEARPFDLSQRARMELSVLESDDVPVQNETDSEEKPVHATISGNILIAEDNDGLRELLKSGLGESYSVSVATNGRDAIEQVRKTNPDLLITDIMMPELDGLDLCRMIKTDPGLSHIPVILITAKSNEVGRLEGMEAGADAYISKPFSFDELMKKVEQLTKQKSLSNP